MVVAGVDELKPHVSHPTLRRGGSGEGILRAVYLSRAPQVYESHRAVGSAHGQDEALCWGSVGWGGVK